VAPGGWGLSYLRLPGQAEAVPLDLDVASSSTSYRDLNAGAEE
jgi:hypothetical protein